MRLVDVIVYPPTADFCHLYFITEQAAHAPSCRCTLLLHYTLHWPPTAAAVQLALARRCRPVGSASHAVALSAAVHPESKLSRESEGVRIVLTRLL